MSRNRASNRAVIVFLVMFVAVASFATLGCAGEAVSGGGNASTFEGVWTGVTAGASSSNVTLTLRASERKLRYGSPRSCDLGLEEPSALDGNRQRYGIVSSTGGYCDRCMMGKLTIKADGNTGDLAYEVTDSGNKVVENGQLRRTGK